MQQKKLFLLTIFSMISSYSFGQDLAVENNQESDSTKAPIVSQELQFGNLHGLGVAFDFNLSQGFYFTSSFGIKSPIQILLGPPFDSNRFNILLGLKWADSRVSVSAGAYLGFYRLTEYLSFITPTLSVGYRINDMIGVEVGASFNTPEKIETRTKISESRTAGASQERLKPAGPTFPFFRLLLDLNILKK